MFNFENAIAAWRKQMSAGGIKTSVVLDELETHLRDDVEQQLRSGINAQQTFESAAQHIGKAVTLKNEFSKVDHTGGQKREFSGNFGVAFALIYLFASTFALMKIEMNLSERILGFSAGIMVVLSFCSLQFRGKFLPPVHNCQARKAIQFACTLSALVWLPSYFYLILPRFDFTLDRLVAAILWAIVPGVALACISSWTKRPTQNIFPLQRIPSPN
ncbi:MAG: hypothetical protein JWQ71_1590 [Pedosphaera sp.]|nr:hypothetical protein [Pedosphaera sp.]